MMIDAVLAGNCLGYRQSKDRFGEPCFDSVSLGPIAQQAVARLPEHLIQPMDDCLVEGGVR